MEQPKSQNPPRKLIFPKEAHSFSSSHPKTIYYSKKKDNNMAWIVDVGNGLVRAVNTKYIKSVALAEAPTEDNKRAIHVLFRYDGNQDVEDFSATTTASIEHIFEVLMNVVSAGDTVVVLFDDLIERAEILSKGGRE